MDYYKILGVEETASPEEIKSAYRKLAAKHHPDRGGDTATFQNINQAYTVLSDSNKKEEYDAARKGIFPNRNHFGPTDINDLFSQMFGHGHNPFARHTRVPKKNKDLTLKLVITLKQSYTGADLEASYKTHSNRQKIIRIKIPGGVVNGTIIKYPNLGDDSDPSLPLGDLLVNITVSPDSKFSRVDNNLVLPINISPIEAMIGCTKSIEHIDGSAISINLPPGTQPNKEYVVGTGFPFANGRAGNFVIIIKVSIPAITDPLLKEKLLKLHDEISTK